LGYQNLRACAEAGVMEDIREGERNGGKSGGAKEVLI
jgi:hypothetical protein